MKKEAKKLTREEKIEKRLKEHYKEALKHFNENQIVGIFLQGSQNYELDIPGSDVDTKLIVLPKLEDIVNAKSPVSTTHVMENDEHMDFKDIRLMIQTFKKQNINFIETLFTKYKIVNPTYKKFWRVLVQNREAIAHMDLLKFVKASKGLAYNKYNGLTHIAPSSEKAIKKYGYDPKQLHHLVRIKYFMQDYLYGGKDYESCLIPENKEYLKDIKKGSLSKDKAIALAKSTIKEIDKMAENVERYDIIPDKGTTELLDMVQYEIIRLGLLEELKRYE